MAASTDARACPVCGARDVRVRAQPESYTFLECRACRTFFVDPMPSDAEIAGDHYTDTYYGADAPRAYEDEVESLGRAAFSKRVERIERALGRTGRILDVGSGTGLQLAAAAARGWDVAGVEISEQAAEFARRAHGVEVVSGTLEAAAFPDEAFDAAICSHVVEHVPDPVRLLREVARVLKADGVAVIAVPNARGLIYSAYNVAHRAQGRYGKDRFSCSLFPPSHLIGFDVRSLKTALARAGLRALSMTITGKGDPAHYPMATWRGAGRAPTVQRVLERTGRALGRGSLIECIARVAR